MINSIIGGFKQGRKKVRLEKEVEDLTNSYSVTPKLGYFYSKLTWIEDVLSRTNEEMDAITIPQDFLGRLAYNLGYRLGER